MLLGEKLRKLRTARKLSQEQLADELQVSRQAISKWELGESTPDTENLIALSQFYGISIDYLLLDQQVNDNQILVSSNKSFLTMIIGISGLFIGLFLNMMLWFEYQRWLILSIGWIIQISSIIFVLFKQDMITKKNQESFFIATTWMGVPFICAYIVSLALTFYHASRPGFVGPLLIFIFYIALCLWITSKLKKN